MEALAVAFPVLVVVSGLILAVLAMRLDRKLSRGSQSAGPRDVVPPEQVGLQRTPWELKALHDQVRSGADRQARHDLVQTVNRLSTAAGVTDPRWHLENNANDHMIANVIATLEQQLELPPIEQPNNQPPVESR